MVLAREMMTAEEAMALVRSVFGIVQRYIPDPSDRQAIADELSALISQEGATYDA